MADPARFEWSIQAKIAGIKQTLNQLTASNQSEEVVAPIRNSQSTGNLLNFEDLNYEQFKTEDTGGLGESKTQQDSSDRNEQQIHDPASSSIFRSPKWDASALPRYETDKIRTLEERLAAKDALMAEMSKMQADLQTKLEECHAKNLALRKQVQSHGSSKRSTDDQMDTNEKENYRQALQEVAVMHDRIGVMEKYREDILSENQRLYVQLEEKEREILRLTDEVTNLQEKEALREEEVDALRRQNYETMRRVDAQTVSPSKARRRGSTSTSRRRLRSTTPTSRSRSRQPSVNKSILASVKRELGTTDSTAVIKTIRRLKKSQTRLSATEQFIEKVTRLMQEFNPSDKRPSLKRIWKWLRKLLEEYMTSRDDRHIDELQILLGVSSGKEVVKQVSRLRHENQKIKQRLSRLNLE